MSNIPSSSGYASILSIITRDRGIQTLGTLSDSSVEVWTSEGWQLGKITKVHRGSVVPIVFSLARPSPLHRREKKDDKGWVRLGGRHAMVFATENMAWKLTDGRVITPMIANRTLPSAAPVPNIFTTEYQQGLEDAARIRDDKELSLREPTSTDYAFGVIQGLTQIRPKSDDPKRRSFYIRRPDLLDWMSTYCTLGGYIMTTLTPPHVRLDPANDTIGWKASVFERPFENDIYVIEGVKDFTTASGVLLLGGGDDAFSN